MEKELKEIIQEFQASEGLKMSVMNRDNQQEIINGWGLEQFTRAFGSLENFFRSQMENGYTKLFLDVRRLQGNRWRKYKEWNVNLHPKKTEEMAYPAQIQAPAPATELPVAQPMGLGAPAFGLGFPQLVDLHVSAHERTRLDTENKYLKEKNERLEKEIEALKLERLETKYSEAKAKGNNEMLMGLLSAAPQLLQAFKGGTVPEIAGTPATMGLGAVPNMADITPEKQELFAVLSQSDTLTDQFLLRLINGFENQQFMMQLEQLLTENQL